MCRAAMMLLRVVFIQPRSAPRYAVYWSWFFFLCFLMALPKSSYATVAQGHVVPRILLVASNHSNKAKAEMLTAQLSGYSVELHQRKFAALVDQGDLSSTFDEYQLVLLDAASPREAATLYGPHQTDIARTRSKVVSLQGMAAADAALKRLNMDGQQATRIYDYYDNGGQENFRRLARYLDLLLNAPDSAQEQQQVLPPIVYPQDGFYHPQANGDVFASLADYWAWYSGQASSTIAQSKPVVGVLFSRNDLESANTEVIDLLSERIAAYGATPLLFYAHTTPQPRDYHDMLTLAGSLLPDVLINTKTLHNAKAREVEFTALDRPVMQADIYFNGDQSAWEQDNQGIPAAMTSFSVVVPESAGVVDPTLIAARNQDSGKREPIRYQVDFIAEKAVKRARLRHIANQDKKLAVMIWGDRDVGASYLNVPASLASISTRLAQEGYGVQAVDADFFTTRVNAILDPFYKDYELASLLEQDMAELLPVAVYRRWFDALPAEIKAPVIARWGEPENNFMVVEQHGEPHFVIPRIRNGNMLVLRQPPRSDTASKDREKELYHATTVPINHYYLAAYLYVREYWQSDALIHLGTHGTHEWLPGKERGLSRYDQGNLAAGALPIIYPFIVDDVGEAMQTKRRGKATVISHMTPPFAAAGLQGDIVDLHEVIHQYESLTEGGVKTRTGDQIVADCFRTTLCQDLGLEKAEIAQDFDAFLVALHDYMHELAIAHQPLGLHTFGQLSSTELQISTLGQMLGTEFRSLAGAFETQAIHAEQRGGDDHDDAAYLVQGDLSEQAGYKTLESLVFNQGSHIPDDIELSEPLVALVEQAKGYLAKLRQIREFPALVSALSGGYTPVANGGDPIRNPDALPTGNNLIGFDPARVPTKAAYEQGKALVKTMLQDYVAEHGSYPNKLAFSLWSMETMRHYGVLESQVLYAIGMKPVWSSDGRVIGTEMIPADALGRPRVDVVLTATGLYRDAFPSVLQWLAEAIQRVARHEEAMNALWLNSQAIERSLLASGVDSDDAHYYASARIFSNDSGNYGAGVAAPLMASGSWESDSKIADVYLARMSYLYGADPARWGESTEHVGLYGKQLSGTDIALFSRSSNIYGLLASDDPFQYFGGLALAIRHLDGESPEMLISDLRNVDHAKTERAATFLARELKTQVFHPRWIQHLQAEGYSGAVELKSRAANFWGWTVTDPNLVRDDQWQSFADVYVKDSLDLDINEWFESANPQAQATMIEIMLEAERKDYWQTDDVTKQALIERYQDLASRFPITSDNEKFKGYLQNQAAGYGLETPQAGDTAVQGQVLQPAPPTPQPADQPWFIWLALVTCFGAFAAGLFTQSQSPVRDERRYRGRLSEVASS